MADRSAAGAPRHLRALNNGLIFSATTRGVRVLPRWVSVSLGHVGTWLAFRLHRTGTAALIDNFRHIFPDLGERELRALALRTYRSYANDTIDFLRALETDVAELRARVAVAEGNGLPALVDGRRGAILLGGHFGNWELGGVVLRRMFDKPLAIMTLPEASEVVGDLRHRMRTSLGIETVEVKRDIETALQVRRLLNERFFVAMLGDRHVDRDRVEVMFFGRRAFFLRSPALMAYFAEAPLLPTFLVRDDDGRFRGVVEPPIWVSRAIDREAAIQQAMQEFATVLERQIRKRPHLWYQFYPYWKEQSDVARH
jgi:Kdo2-lipid IVA lauroyltransferase/acyltransferase